ncbi:hypothetical protein DFQ26_001156, partial [Actinomortierella ambigua]
TAWKFDNAPVDGLLDITFPLNIANSAHIKGYTYAYMLAFSSITDISTIILQPLMDMNGKSRFYAQFMTMQEGTTTTSNTCVVKTGGNASGVTCHVLIYGDYTHPYSLVVENVGGTTWRGKVVDTQDHVETLIGELTLPSFAGNINAGDEQLGHVDYFPWRSSLPHECSTLPRTEVQLFNPTSKTAGASGGKVNFASWTDNCAPEMVNFSSTSVPGGLDIKVGTV